MQERVRSDSSGTIFSIKILQKEITDLGKHENQFHLPQTADEVKSVCLQQKESFSSIITIR